MTQQLLLEDFESALEFIRVQKIVNKLRNSDKIREYRNCMNHWLSSAPLKGARKGKLKRHLEICLAIQEIFDSIDNEGEGLELWEAPERRILEYIFSAVEQYRFAKQKPHTTAGDAGVLGGLRQTEIMRRDVRNFCDRAALLVGQVAKHPSSSDQTEITDDALARAIGLAASTDLVMEIFNMYTYKNIPLSVGSKHLRVGASTNTMEQALTWSTLRERSYEIDRYHSINMQMEVLAAEVASSLGFMVSDFEPFMISNTGRDIWKRSKFVATALEAISTAEVYSLVEPEISFTTRHGRFAVSELIRFWATLFQLAYCAYIWEKLTKRAEAPVVSNVGLKTLLSPANSTDQLEKLIEQFSLNPKLKNQDPFYRPIVKLDGTHSLLARTFIETGRFSRNLFTIAIAESDLDFVT